MDMAPSVERFVVWLPGERDPLDLRRCRPRRRYGERAFYLVTIFVSGAAILLPWPGAAATSLLGPVPGALVVAAAVGMLLAILPGRPRARALVTCLAMGVAFLGVLPDTRGGVAATLLIAEAQVTAAHLLPTPTGALF
jgi:hypothetical protein